MELHKLPTIPGSDPQSVFYVVAEQKNLQLGVRFWGTPTSVPNRTEIGFRIRVTFKEQPGDKASSIIVEEATKACPNVLWMGVSQKHVSVSGKVAINANPADLSSISAALRAPNVLPELTKRLMKDFAWFDIPATEEEFADALRIEILRQVENVNAPLFAGVTEVLVTYGEKKQQHPAKSSPKDDPLESVGLGAGSVTGKPSLPCGSGDSVLGTGDASGDSMASQAVGEEAHKKPTKLKTLKPTPTPTPKDKKPS